MIVGWIFTEMGRQPWIVFSLLLTAVGVSPNVTGLEVLISLVAFTLIYGALAVVEFRLDHPGHQEGATRGRRTRIPRPAASNPPRRSTRRTRTWISRCSGSGSSPFLFVGYFVLDGFDFGVGMSLPFLGTDDTDRRVLINTIGPVWDLNETWVIVAGASLFAAFPEWYATLFSRVLPRRSC